MCVNMYMYMYMYKHMCSEYVCMLREPCLLIRPVSMCGYSQVMDCVCVYVCMYVCMCVMYVCVCVYFVHVFNYSLVCMRSKDLA